MSKICIIHYHLNPGGVTRIIESQIRCLKERDSSTRILVLTGHCDNPDFYKILGADLVVDNILNYLPEDTGNLMILLEHIKELLSEHIDQGDIIHFHNMNLGKNPLLTVAVSLLAKDGYFVLNHAHDFAEDRESNYQFIKRIIQDELGMHIRRIMYPELPNYLFATLNSADRERLINYQVSDTRTFLLPNPVDISTKGDTLNKTELKRSICLQLGIDPHKLLITYPVRVIRRKNIGEFILLSMLFSNSANWVVTQPPKNPVEIISYEAWKQFCLEKNIKLVFEAGLRVNFEELIQSSDWCFTTSIQEGFGMVYMEPWLLGTPVGGRNLEYITTDLSNSGMIFPLLYDQIQVGTEEGNTDFALLEMGKQMRVISDLLNKRDNQQKTIRNNPLLKIIFEPIGSDIIECNRSTIINEYSLQKYAKRLEGIYKEFTK
jgi:glycosyltransferase involved in cell wall biosynthesis